MNEPCQVQGRDNTSQGVSTERWKRSSSESENLGDCDCDQTVGVLKNIIEGNDTSNQRKVIETILDWERA